MSTIVALLIGSAGLAVILLVSRRMMTQQVSRQRVFEATGGDKTLVAPEQELGWLGWWLIRAGYRWPVAPQAFLGATAACFVLGVMLAYLFYARGTLRILLGGLEDLPGGMGDVFLPLAYGLPWIAVVLIASFPWLWVRSSRRRRITQIEQDLPITLELLATLGDAGIGFDAALDRILESQEAERALAEEFRLFQLEVLAGRPRVQCLRRLSRRLDVTSFTVFVSALVQATQVGAGMADVLRRQVEDLRNRRRERALGAAATMPVKLLFPLVLCFLPGIMVAALGPAFYQFFQIIEMMNHRMGR